MARPDLSPFLAKAFRPDPTQPIMKLTLAQPVTWKPFRLLVRPNPACDKAGRTRPPYMLYRYLLCYYNTLQICFIHLSHFTFIIQFDIVLLMLLVNGHMSLNHFNFFSKLKQSCKEKKYL